MPINQTFLDTLEAELPGALNKLQSLAPEMVDDTGHMARLLVGIFHEAYREQSAPSIPDEAVLIIRDSDRPRTIQVSVQTDQGESERVGMKVGDTPYAIFSYLVATERRGQLQTYQGLKECCGYGHVRGRDMHVDNALKKLRPLGILQEAEWEVGIMIANVEDRRQYG